jgi:hypothetical protein
MKKKGEFLNILNGYKGLLGGVIVLFFGECFWYSGSLGNCSIFPLFEKEIFDSLKRKILTVWKGKF